ncbi:DegT/DnrJ/EryC1/StrS family aminotransferase [Lentzea sp.]|uniref:DegT/DnrJ/EryC1/StrS family aminotransferase n=1 Tax=Lentzea sp. TaxID=56099 RepID=UPI002C63B1E9|nr:DegT/DnrJ/EryC1/StrS family aminotransferase [Lentzea sp.]HUQ56458.1 DegT/DnrJ/EryC1/StrS family aminotransferase [Lentzea sp.]
MTTTLPFFPDDLFESDRAVTLDLIRRVGGANEQKFILGAAVARLEETIAGDTGARHVIACGSGTGALTLAVHATGAGPGDEVVVPAFCCQPVASTVANRGATPVFADIDPWTLVLDPGSAEQAITPRTRAIMPAHVFSVMADMPSFEDIARRRGLRLIEDAAVAQGAVLDGRPSGTWGDLGVFSFFQVKALGTIGEGGVVLTDDDELGASVRRLRNHGQSSRFVHTEIGYNSRMDEVVAEFLLHRYDLFAQRLQRRADIAAYYTEQFADLRDDGLLPPPAGMNGRCYYVYAVLTDRRDALRDHLAARGVGTHVYYPLPLPSQPAFAKFARGMTFPNAVAAGRRNLALPIWPHLTDAEVEHIATSVREFHR